MIRRKVFNELVECYGKRFPHHKGKQQVITNECKNIKNIKDNSSKKKKGMKRSSNKRTERKHEQILHGCQQKNICNSFC